MNFRRPDGASGTLIVRGVRIVSGVVLLILSAVLPSPLNKSAKQTEPSPTCPRPWQFQAWMGASVGLLALFILATAWRRYRARQRRRLPAAYPPINLDPEARPRTRTPRANGADTGAQPPIPPVPRVQSRSVPNLADPTAPPPAQMRPVPHSYSTPTLNAMNGAPSPGASTAALTLVTSATSKKPRLSGGTVTPGTAVAGLPSASSSTPSLGTNTAPVPVPPIPVPPIPAPEAARPGNQSTVSLAASARSVRLPYPEPYLPPADQRAMRQAQRFRKIDSLADIVDSLYTLRFALFIIGHILLFKPSPVTETTCYHSAPLLWWGVFAGLLYDWVRIALWIVVAFGAIILMMRNLYRIFAVRMGWRPPPPAPPAPTPAPVPLTSAELAGCKTVCYVPDPTDPVSDDGHSIDGEAVSPTEIDQSRLPLPAAMLPAHRATCGVCQENFTAPREIARIMYKVTELRQLPCDHVFHKACVDQWLKNHSDSCPFCNQSVREGLKRMEVARSAAASRVSLPARPSAAASRTSLPMAMASRNASRTSSLHIATMFDNPPPSHSRPRSSGASVSHSAAASRSSLALNGFSASRTSLPYTSTATGASRTSLPYTSAAAGASRTSLGNSASRTSLQHTSARRPSRSQSCSPSSPYSPHSAHAAASHSSIGLGLGISSAMASRTSLASDSEGYNIPRSTSRSSIGMNAASGSRISLSYMHPGGSRTSLSNPAACSRTSLTSPASPSPTTTPTLGSRQSVQYMQYQYPSAAASRTSLVPVPEGLVTDSEVPPLPTATGVNANSGTLGQAL